MRVTVVQLSPGSQLGDNVVAMERMVRAACRADRTDMIVLPEMWSCLGGTTAEKFAASESLPGRPEFGPDDVAGPIYRCLASLAASERVVVIGGSIGERVGERLYNTSIAFDADGRELARYRKIHLFDVVTPEGASYLESATYDAGDAVVAFEACGLRVGCTICYDLRFPALFEALRGKDVELISVPAAFTVETGRAHWEVLLRARAIETQCWIAAAATVGSHRDASGALRSTFGQSMICDPWGAVVARVSDGPGWASARIDGGLTERIRRDMPVRTHRKSLS